MVGLLDVLLHRVVRQVPEGGPFSGRLPFQSVYSAVEGAVGQMVVDGGLRGSEMIDGRIIGKTANSSSQGSHSHQHSHCCCRIHAGGDGVLKGAGNSAAIGNGPGESHPVGAAAELLSWLRWEQVGGAVIGMRKPQETDGQRAGTGLSFLAKHTVVGSHAPKCVEPA